MYPSLLRILRRLALSSVLGLLAAAPGAAADRPNILIILADDMGYSDLGLFGSGIHTPNLDRLAREGLLFTEFYNEAKCTPTRAALMSGRHSRAVLDGPGPGVRSEGALGLDVPTLPEHLRRAGYRTYMSGKWHLGDTPERWPTARGFDRAFSLITGASSYYEMRMREEQDDPVRRQLWPPKPFLVRDSVVWTPPASDFYLTDAITENAVDQVRAHRARGGDQPFFLYLAYTAPHFPLHAPESAVAAYRGRFSAGWDVERTRRLAAMQAAGLMPAEARLAAAPATVPAWDAVGDKAQWARRMEVYAAQLDLLDRGVGRVLAALQETGQLDDTLILFLSDNGASAEGLEKGFGYHDPAAPIGSPRSNTAYKEPWAAVSSTPLRAYKLSLYEGGIRTPLIVSWPAGLRRHGLATSPGHVTDVLPTVLDAAGQRPGTPGGDSRARSLLPILTERAAGGRAQIFWAFRTQRAMREGRWKIVSPAADTPWELYDLHRDPSEQTDLASTDPARVRRMSEAWAAWAGSEGRSRQQGDTE